MSGLGASERAGRPPCGASGTQAGPRVLQLGAPRPLVSTAYGGPNLKEDAAREAWPPGRARGGHTQAVPRTPESRVRVCPRVGAAQGSTSWLKGRGLLGGPGRGPCVSVPPGDSDGAVSSAPWAASPTDVPVDQPLRRRRGSRLPPCRALGGPTLPRADPAPGHASSSRAGGGLSSFQEARLLAGEAGRACSCFLLGCGERDFQEPSWIQESLP